MIKPQTSKPTLTALFATGSLLACLNLVGCGSPSDEEGVFDEAISQLDKSESVALPEGVSAPSPNDAQASSQAFQSFMEEDQLEARRAAYKDAEASLKTIVGSGTPKQQQAAKAMLASVKIADANTALARIRENLPVVQVKARSLQTQAAAFDATFQQIVHLSPKADDAIASLKTAVAAEQEKAAATQSDIDALEQQRAGLKQQIEAHQAKIAEFGRAKAAVAREQMGADGREAFVLNNANFAWTQKVNGEQGQINALQDQVRVLEAHSGLLASKKAAHEKTVQVLSSMQQRLEASSQASIEVRESSRQMLNEQGALLASGVNDLLDSYQNTVAEPVQTMLAGLEGQTESGEFGAIETNITRLEGMTIQHQALQRVATALKAVESRMTGDEPTIGAWRAQALGGSAATVTDALAKAESGLEDLAAQVETIGAAAAEALVEMVGEEAMFTVFAGMPAEPSEELGIREQTAIAYVKVLKAIGEHFEHAEMPEGMEMNIQFDMSDG